MFTRLTSPSPRYQRYRSTTCRATGSPWAAASKAVRPSIWSSFPPHSHVEPEIYFYKFLPENGYGFGEFGDEAYKIKHNDLTGMPDEKTHSQCVAPGYAEYYLWVIRLQDDKDIVTTVVPEYAWTTEPGAKYFPEI